MFTSNKSKKRYRINKILKPKTYKDKCSRVELYKEGKHKTYLVYRLELCAFTNIPYESKLTAQHIDGNRLNNNLSNLMWLTRGDNIRQGFVDGLYTSQIKTYVIDKFTNEKFEFRSMAIASEFIGKNKNYISNNIKKGSYCNDKYEWQIEH